MNLQDATFGGGRINLAAQECARRRRRETTWRLGCSGSGSPKGAEGGSSWVCPVYAGTGARLLDGPASDRPACDRPGIDRRLRRHPLGEESSGNPPSGDHASAADAAAADSPRSHPDGGQLEPHRILWCLSCEDRLRERTSLAAGALATALVGAALATAEVRPLALRTPCAASPQPHPAPEPPRSSRCCAPRRALPHPD